MEEERQEKINIEKLLEKQFKSGTNLNKAFLKNVLPAQASVFTTGISLVNLETEEWHYFLVKDNKLCEVTKKEWFETHENL